MRRMPTSIGSRAAGARGDREVPPRPGGGCRRGAGRGSGQGRPGGVERRVSSHSTCGSWSLTWSWNSELIRTTW